MYTPGGDGSGGGGSRNSVTKWVFFGALMVLLIVWPFFQR